ncbi:MAG: hypothetical protein PWQ35_197 [Patescibacteria group bacterium]|nr:hypothetical protein [Patescibacteria group bacterium]
MIFGENAKIVQTLIIEFIDSFDKIAYEEKMTNLKGREGFNHAIILHEISRLFIIGPNFDKGEKLFNAIHDAYNQRNGIRDFIIYRDVLKKEKEAGFINLALITKMKK